MIFGHYWGNKSDFEGYFDLNSSGVGRMGRERRAVYDVMVFIELRVVVVVGAALVADTLLVVLLICLVLACSQDRGL